MAEMSHNAGDAMKVGQDKPIKDYVDGYDAEHGKYTESKGGKPTQAQPTTLPNTPSPFTLTK
jgi:hypothetical protein